MNKKGFTLTELLAVIAIISIIALIAIPNITNVTDNVRKENMLDDAKKFISLAKLKVNSDYNLKTTGATFNIIDLNDNGDFAVKDGHIVDVDSGVYDNNSYVKYEVLNNTSTYYVYLKGSKRHIGTSSNPKKENELTSKNIVINNS